MSLKANAQSPSLNDCLETRPPLPFEILLRNWMRKYCVAGDIQKAFIRIRVHEQDRDAQRILWFDNLIERNSREYRFSELLQAHTFSERHFRNIYKITKRSSLRQRNRF